MAEYIESICRRCFHSYVCEQFNEHRDDHNERCHYFSDHFVPAADVVEVVHGEWKYICYEDGVHPKDVYACTNCGAEKKVVYRKYLEPEKWCYNCGAKMDGDKHG